MINFNNHNITGMSYNGHTIKRAYGCDARLVWEKEFGGKLGAKYKDGRTYRLECNSSPKLTSGDTHPSGYQASAMTSAAIGQCVTEIGINAFKDYNIASVVIPNSVKTIGEGAFYGCNYITSLEIPDSVTTIGQYGCAYCTRVKNLTIGNGLKKISNSCFRAYISMTGLTIGSGVTEIDTYAFESCSALTSVVIPDSVKSLNGNSFMGCYGLKEITIGTGITRIEQFYVVGLGSSRLEKITINATTPPALYGNPFNNTNNCPIYVPCQSVNAYKTAWPTLASRITCIQPPFTGKWLATYQDGHVESGECDSTSAITNGEVTKQDLVQIEIGQCVTSIGDSAFSNASSLTSIKIWQTTPPTLGGTPFANTGNAPIYVPASSVDLYKSQWSGYASRIQPIT